MNRTLFPTLALSVTLAIALTSCSKPDEEAPTPATSPTPQIETVEDTAPASPAEIDLTKRPPKQLSAFNFFKDPAKQIPNEGVIAYKVNNDHFADYASIKRFFWLPKGTQLTYDATGAFQFPEGAIILQTFSFPDTAIEGGTRLVETRLLMNAGGIDGWDAIVYRWNEEMTDAKSSVAGKLIEVQSVSNATEKMSYLVPNINDCARCHENNEGMRNPIGVTARNLSLVIDGKNQLALWSEQGLFKEAPANDYPATIVWDDPATGSVEDRSRTWLDINCAHCHNPNGPASVSGLDLSITQSNPMSIGMYKPPVAAGQGSEGFDFSIDPGSPETSFLINRLHSTNPAVMMPPLGRMTSNQEAVALISEWIASIEFTEAEAQELIAEQKERVKQLLEGGVIPAE